MHLLAVALIQSVFQSGSQDVFAIECAEERLSDGDVYLGSSDLEMGVDPSRGEQLVGCRFEINIPAGANVTSAAITFQVDEITDNAPLTLEIKTSIDASSPFEDVIHDVSYRDTVDEPPVQWALPESNTVGSEVTTPDISSLVEAAVAEGTWSGAGGIMFTFGMVSGSSQGLRIYESDAPRLTIRYTQGDENQRLKRLEQLVLEMAEHQQESNEEAERMRGVIGALGRQSIMSQFNTEFQVRSRGGSGLRGVRSMQGGTRPYHTAGESSYGFANIHNHADFKYTIGMGEVGAVINGVEFRTRHNDYTLAEPSSTSQEYHDYELVDLPDVPPSVLNAGSVQNQSHEMRQYFLAWQTGNISHRDYRPYFRPVLSYMEGAWIKASDEMVEPFFSDRHSIEGETWDEVHQTARFLANSGAKNARENMVVLPQAVRKMTGDRKDIPEFAQFEYRIMAKRLEGDVPLDRFRVVDDLASAVRDLDRGRTMDDIKSGNLRTSRFQLDPECRAGYDGCPAAVLTLNDCLKECIDTWNSDAWGVCWRHAYCTWPEQDDDEGCNSLPYEEPFVSTLAKPTWTRCRSNAQSGWKDGTSREGLETYTFMDHLMEQVPGKDNAGCYLNDTFDRSMRWTNWDHPDETELLNTCYYSRYYESTQRDAMGRDNRRRSFNDPNLWAAQTSQEDVSGIDVQIDYVGEGCDGCEDRLEQKWSWAFPLEIIFLTPLSTWNPYGLQEKSSDEVTANGRDGGLSQSEAFDGVSTRNWYLTPAEFYEGLSDGGDPADTDLGVVGVLDPNGNVQRVVASGHYITMPNIPGIDHTIRQRYPIAPLHDEDSTIYKELKAMEDILDRNLTHDLLGSKFRQKDGVTGSESGALSLTLTAGTTGHEHGLVIPAKDVPALLAGEAVASTSERRNGHIHDVLVRLVQGQFVMDSISPFEEHGISGNVGDVSSSSSSTSPATTTTSAPPPPPSTTTPPPPPPSTTTPPPPPPPTTTTTTVATGAVHEISWGWDVGEASITISVGDTVRWVWNQDPDGTHNIMSGVRGDPDGLFQSAYYSRGGSFEHTFQRAGTYPYHCVPHGGMNAVITVVDDTRSESDCIALDWPYKFGHTDVCGESQCVKHRNFEDAKALCAAEGARLCSVEELHTDVTRGTGCGHDLRRVWARDSGCAPGEQMLGWGRSNQGDAICAPSETTIHSSGEIGVRCCADSPDMRLRRDEREMMVSMSSTVVPPTVMMAMCAMAIVVMVGVALRLSGKKSSNHLYNQSRSSLLPK